MVTEAQIRKAAQQAGLKNFFVGRRELSSALARRRIRASLIAFRLKQRREAEKKALALEQKRRRATIKKAETTAERIKREAPETRQKIEKQFAFQKREAPIKKPLQVKREKGRIIEIRKISGAEATRRKFLAEGKRKIIEFKQKEKAPPEIEEKLAKEITKEFEAESRKIPLTERIFRKGIARKRIKGRTPEERIKEIRKEEGFITKRIEQRVIPGVVISDKGELIPIKPKKLTKEIRLKAKITPEAKFKVIKEQEKLEAKLFGKKKLPKDEFSKAIREGIEEGKKEFPISFTIGAITQAIKTGIKKKAIRAVPFVSGIETGVFLPAFAFEKGRRVGIAEDRPSAIVKEITKLPFEIGGFELGQKTISSVVKVKPSFKPESLKLVTKGKRLGKFGRGGVLIERQFSKVTKGELEFVLPKTIKKARIKARALSTSAKRIVTEAIKKQRVKGTFKLPPLEKTEFIGVETEVLKPGRGRQVQVLKTELFGAFEPLPKKITEDVLIGKREPPHAIDLPGKAKELQRQLFPRRFDPLEQLQKEVRQIPGVLTKEEALRRAALIPGQKKLAPPKLRVSILPFGKTLFDITPREKQPFVTGEEFNKLISRFKIRIERGRQIKLKEFFPVFEIPERKLLGFDKAEKLLLENRANILKILSAKISETKPIKISKKLFIQKRAELTPPSTIFEIPKPFTKVKPRGGFFRIPEPKIKIEELSIIKKARPIQKLRFKEFKLVKALPIPKFGKAIDLKAIARQQQALKQIPIPKEKVLPDVEIISKQLLKIGDVTKFFPFVKAKPKGKLVPKKRITRPVEPIIPVIPKKVKIPEFKLPRFPAPFKPGSPFGGLGRIPGIGRKVKQPLGLSPDLFSIIFGIKGKTVFISRRTGFIGLRKVPVTKKKRRR